VSREIILFIPGISGTYLRDRRSGKLNWGRPSYLLAWRDYHAQQLPFRPGQVDRVTPGPVLDHVHLCRLLRLRIPFYDHCFRTLRERAGRVQGDIDHLSKEADLYPWPFDWRRSLADAARELDATVERLLDFYQDPDLRITLISHSSGGMAANLWWTHGAADVRECEEPPPPTFPRRRNLGRLIQVGVPHRGTLKIMVDLAWGIRVLRLGRRYHPDFLFSMPPMYELLPFQTAGRFLGPDGEPAEIDLFNVDNWYSRRLGLFTRFPRLLDDPDVRAFFERTLPRARRVQRALSQPWPEEMAGRVHLLAGRSHRTIRRLRLTPQGIDLEDALQSILPPERVGRRADEAVEPGDWFAPHESLTALSHQPENCHETHCIHRHLFSDEEAKRGLIQALSER
jgi:hypothetical protein